MKNVNKVILLGNVVAPPDVRTPATGKPVANFTVATTRSWTDPSGERHSEPEFHPVVAFGGVADICQRFLQKGTLVYIEGSLKTRTWQHEESGMTMKRTEIIAIEVIVLARGLQEGAPPSAGIGGSGTPRPRPLPRANPEEPHPGQIRQSVEQSLLEGNERATSAVRAPVDEEVE